MLLVSYGLKIIHLAEDFKNALLTWYQKFKEKQTWCNFKLQFSKAYEDSLKGRGNSIENTTCHQINSIVAKFSNKFSKIFTVANAVFFHKHMDPDNNNTTTTDVSSITYQTNFQANVITNKKNVYDLLTQIWKQLNFFTQHRSNWKLTSNQKKKYF